MRKATDLEIKQFVNYRSIHIGLVERIGALVFGENYSDHDWDKCTCNEEDLNLYALRNAKINGDYNPTGEDKKKIEKLPAKHVKMNKHHPEYWDDNITINNFSDDDPPQCHASKMPQRWLKEMCCDWSAVALKRNKPIFKWYNETCIGDNPRFVFTDNQKSFIIDCLKKIQDTIEKEHITYPGIKYDVKQIEPVVDLNESMTKEDKDQILKFADEIKYHGLEYHDLPGHIAWDGLVKDGKKYPSFRENLEIEEDLVKVKEYSKENLINDINNIEKDAITLYKNSSDNDLLKASAEGRVATCEDIKDLANDLTNISDVKDVNDLMECEMSGGFTGMAPEKVIKIVDPSGTLDNSKEEKEDTN